MPTNDKIEKALAAVDKRFGKGLVKRANEFPPVGHIKSRIPLLDYTFTGGPPRGMITELWGPPKGGKTSLTNIFLGEEQKFQAMQEDPRGQLYFDLENTHNGPWAQKLGVDIEDLRMIKHGAEDAKGDPLFLTAEDVINITWDAVMSGAFSMIVWDSLAAMTPKSIVEKRDANQRPVGDLALLMSNQLPEMVRALYRKQCSLIIVNQYREKIGVMYGNPATRPGGNALEHYAAMIANVRVGDFFEAKYKDPETGAELGKRRVGNECRIRVEKNKVGPPFRECVLSFYYDTGVDTVTALRDLCLDLRVVEQGGRFYRHHTFTDPSLPVDLVNTEKGYVEGKERLLQLMKTCPPILDIIRDECERALSGG